MQKENNVVIKQVVIPEFARPARTRGSSTHPPFCNETTNDKRGRFPIETLGNDAIIKTRQCGGFTLIELLVVVLIIGILAAVALPQYQKAVERSRAAQALTLLKSISQAAQTYHLANGVWPTKFEELDVEIPWTGNKKWHLSAQDTKSNGEWSAQLYTEDTSSYLMLWIGRISGPYAGTGLAAVSSRNFQPMCTEDTTGHNTSSFSLGEGAYCQKVMRGSFLWGNGGMDYYTLP